MISIDPQTLLGAAVALFAVAVSAAVLYWPQPSVTRDVILRAADRDADAEALDAQQRRDLRRRAERYALDVHEGRVTLGDALHRISCDAAMMRKPSGPQGVGLMR